MKIKNSNAYIEEIQSSDDETSPTKYTNYFETELYDYLKSVNQQNQKLQKDLQYTSYNYENFTLYIDRVQGDPQAQPSSIHININHDISKFPIDTYNNKSKKIALCDLLTRFIDTTIIKIGANHKYISNNQMGIKGGDIQIDKPSQIILERTSVLIFNKFIECRLEINLPAKGRSIISDMAIKAFKFLPIIINDSLIYNTSKKDEIYQHIYCNEDQDYLRQQLNEINMICFVRNNALLPRLSGINDKPMKDDVILFNSPKSMEISINLPNQGVIYGMGIKSGITLIIGGGFHGKSTLLNAIQQGIYNHIPGDGREQVITNNSAIKIKSEEGRYINNVNISPFINNLPQNKTTNNFSTDDASGSTSQSANIIEQISLESKLLLIDEDTCATNFMIRDKRMQLVITKDKEPITPLIYKIKQLYNDYNVSSIIIMGGSGDQFEVSDNVLCLHEYKVYDQIDKVKEVIKQYNNHIGENEGGEIFGDIGNRMLIQQQLNCTIDNRDKIRVRDKCTISFGECEINLRNIEQLQEKSQTNVIADSIKYLKNYKVFNKINFNELLNMLEKEFDSESGLDIINKNKHIGNYSRPRKLEIAAAINRLRIAKFVMI